MKNYFQNNRIMIRLLAVIFVLSGLTAGNGAQASGGNFSLNMDYTKYSIAWDYLPASTVYIGAGEWLYLRMNIKWNLGSQGNTVIVWSADSCPTNSSCLMQTMRDINNSLQATWNVFADTPYQSYLQIQTTPNTPVGTYPIIFKVKENSESCGDSCIPEQTKTVNVVVTNVPKGTIGLTPGSLSFPGVSGGSVPAAQGLKISNSGQGALDWVVSTNQNWCHVNQVSGTLAPGANIFPYVTVDAPSNVGTFNCIVSLSSLNANNSPQTTAVTYVVAATAPPAEQPGPGAATLTSLVPNHATLSEVQAQMSTNILGTNFDSSLVTNLVSYISDATGQQIGIGNVSFVNGGIKAWVPANLKIGTYKVRVQNGRDFIHMVSNPLTFTVLPDPPKPAILLTPNALSFQAISGQAKPLPQSVNIKNTGNGSLNWSASTSQNWCHLDSVSGVLAPGQLAILNVLVDDPSNVGVFKCSVILSDAAAINSPQQVGVTYAVAAMPQAKIALSPAQLVFSTYSNGLQPDPKNASLKNTGTADLNWAASASMPWCHVSPLSGKLTPGKTQNLQVSVDDPSNIGTFGCAVKVEDPKAENSSQSLAVSYKVNQFIGDPANLVAVDKPCGAITLAWDSGDGASGYNIYRNTKNTVPAVALVAGYAGTEYKDTTVKAGTKYYYWVESLGGTLSTKVSAASNIAGGVLVNACLISEIPIEPPLIAASSPTCETADLQWTNVVNEDGYYVYRNSTGNLPTVADRVATTKANETVFSEKLAGGSYYYWVSSYNTKGESARAVSNPPKVSAASCVADLSASDKNIISINGAPLERTICDYDKFQGLPDTKTVLQINDTLTYEVNLCNSAINKDAKNVVVTDQLTNLDAPAGGLGVKLDGQAMSVSNGTSPKAGEYYYNPASRELTMNVGTVKKQGQRQVAYSVVVKTQPNYTSICPRCQNKAVITYSKDDNSTGTVELHSPAIFYSVKLNSVSN